MAATPHARSSLAITLSVWRALFLREASARLARNPVEWFWVLAEPIAHIAFLMWIFVVGFRQRTLVGADTPTFIMLGVLAFFLPRNLINRSIATVGASEALYGFRQVKPVDTVIARAGLESLIYCLVFAVVWTGAALLAFPVFPADPLGALAALGGLWVAGLGLALTLSVVANLSEQIARIVRLLMGPLYIFSAIIYPSAGVPPAMRDVLLLNPLVHGIESLRVAFMPEYKVPTGIDLAYLVQFGVLFVFMGLALHARFEEFLKTR